jgi:hypothetical protein
MPQGSELSIGKSVFYRKYYIIILIILLFTCSENITTCLANIHSFVLRDCRQLPWAGDLSPEITINKIKYHEKKKDQIKIEAVKVPNLPYSKTILHERIK